MEAARNSTHAGSTVRRRSPTSICDSGISMTFMPPLRFYEDQQRIPQ
ncbi:hypothetical protein GMO_21690 [Gluconobacter morbifer G707]|uniref:Uncharacterized protein n=1 Tax=Gluconobacter morbifer G707 TaxID=1088869 RepID=G6XLC1_9PROT|nr:hypothetical protein GMO_21690 [Gluconobacter morbifer G707]